MIAKVAHLIRIVEAAGAPDEARTKR